MVILLVSSSHVKIDVLQLRLRPATVHVRGEFAGTRYLEMLKCFESKQRCSWKVRYSPTHEPR